MTLPRVVSPIASSKGSRLTAPLILASASPRRSNLLAQIGIIPDLIIPADIDETPLRLPKGVSEGVRDYAKRMALEKARLIADKNVGAIVLAADTVVSVGARILPKAEDEMTARKCLALISGRSHRVYSGVCVITPDGGAIEKIIETRVKVRRLSHQHGEEYLASGEWNGKAGGYAIQGLFARHVISVIGSYTNIVGLPLYETANMLAGAGWVTPDHKP